jgi:hypothetical protein
LKCWPRWVMFGSDCHAGMRAYCTSSARRPNYHKLESRAPKRFARVFPAFKAGDQSAADGSFASAFVNSARGHCLALASRDWRGREWMKRNADLARPRSTPASWVHVGDARLPLRTE